MKVYRLEKDNSGPYRYRGSLGSLESDKMRNNLEYTHSSGIERLAWGGERAFLKAKLTEVHNYRSACGSLQDLMDWFGDFFDDLIAAGFKVTTYFAEEYVLAHNQLIFKFDTARRII